MMAAPVSAFSPGELAAMLRFVAEENPHLTLALVWAIVTNPDAVVQLRAAERLVLSRHLVELTNLDPALRAAVEASGPALLRMQVPDRDPL